MGQVLGGFLVAADVLGWSWRLIFLVNLPVGAVALVLAGFMVPESRGEGRPGLDWGGVGLASAGLFLLIFPVVAGREAGWPAWSFGMLAGVAPVLAVFVWYERRVVREGATPLIALHLFGMRMIRLGLLASVAFFLGLGVFFVVMTVTLQAGFLFTPLQAGLVFLPFAVGFSLASAVSGWVTARLGARILNLGTGLMGVGLLVLLAGCQAGLAVVWVEVALVVYGVGQGLAQPALINTVIGGSGIGPDDTGSAVGLFLTTAQSCIAFGVAAIGDVFFTRLGVAPGVADYLAALSVTLWCNLVLLGVTFGLALVLRRRRAVAAA
jgi:MFS family permease